MNAWTLPLFSKPIPKNICGECKECCTVLPINQEGWVKPAGKPCEHLCEKGCDIFGAENWPTVCRTYLCGWRSVDWLGTQPDCRPDRLGVIIQDHTELVAVFEVRPQAAYEPKVCAVVRKFQQKYKGSKKLRVNVYEYQGVTWNNEEMTRQQGIHANEATWMLRREPYEHFVLEKVESMAKMNARILLDFFAMNPGRDTCNLSVPEKVFEEIITVRRESIPEVEAIRNGKTPEGELAWMSEFPLVGLTAYSGGTRTKAEASSHADK